MAEPTPARTRALRVGALMLYFAVALGVVIVLGTSTSHSRHAEIERGRELWRDRCTQCHTLLRTLSPREAFEWRGIGARMAHKPDAKVTEEEVRSVVRFLSESNDLPSERRRGYWVLRANRERWRALFERKCSTCHATGDLPRGRERAGWLFWCMERDRRRDTFWIGVSEKQQIFDYLHLGDLESPLAYFRADCPSCHSRGFSLAFLLGLDLPRDQARLDDEGLMAKRCFECHTETILDPCRDAAEWKRIVERMRLKAPHFVSEDETERLVAFLAAPRDCNSVATVKREGSRSPR